MPDWANRRCDVGQPVAGRRALQGEDRRLAGGVGQRARAEWEKLRDMRAKGQDPAVDRRARRVKDAEEKKTARVQSASKQTARALVELYLTGHVERNRKQKGIDETRRTLSYALRVVSPDDWPGEFGDLDAAKITRAQALS